MEKLTEYQNKIRAAVSLHLIAKTIQCRRCHYKNIKIAEIRPGYPASQVSLIPW
jgi:hypothetical protein